MICQVHGAFSVKLFTIFLKLIAIIIIHIIFLNIVDIIQKLKKSAALVAMSLSHLRLYAASMISFIRGLLVFWYYKPKCDNTGTFELSFAARSH